jgi:hypothetical protein
LLGADDSTGNLEKFVLDVVQNQFLVLAFRHLAVKVLLELLLVSTDRTGGQIEQFS